MDFMGFLKIILHEVYGASESCIARRVTVTYLFYYTTPKGPCPLTRPSNSIFTLNLLRNYDSLKKKVPLQCSYDAIVGKQYSYVTCMSIC